MQENLSISHEITRKTIVTMIEAYKAMIVTVEKYNERLQSDDIYGLLSDMSITTFTLSTGPVDIAVSADPAVMYYWENSLKEIITQRRYTDPSVSDIPPKEIPQDTIITMMEGYEAMISTIQEQNKYLQQYDMYILLANMSYTYTTDSHDPSIMENFKNALKDQISKRGKKSN